jgi:hypothetical protein
MKNKADRSTHEPSFTVGDIVYAYCPVVTPGRQRKFIRPWVGPFYITQKLSPLHVKIRRKSDGKLIKNRVHINRLKHVFRSENCTQELCFASKSCHLTLYNHLPFIYFFLKIFSTSN